jgi:hypothetical protein
MIHRVHLVILLGFALRLIVSAWNGFVGPSIGAELDAVSFHLKAIEYSKSPTLEDAGIGWVYANLLGYVYYFTMESLFLGGFLSCAAWLASALILKNSLNILQVDSSAKVYAMMLYALLPSSVMFTSVTLREPYQLLFVNIAINAVLNIYYHRAYKYWSVLALAIAGGGAMHGGLLAFGVFLFSGSLLLVATREKKKKSWIRGCFLGFISVAALWFGYQFFTYIAYNLEQGVGNAIEAYQNSVRSQGARTNYMEAVDISGLSGMFLHIFGGLVQYLFEPYPWKITSASDIVVLLENVLRGWLIWRMGVNFMKASGSQRNLSMFLILAYLMIETMWSLGTTNWGTAVRHHIPSFGLLLLTAYFAANQRRNVRSKSFSAVVFKTDLVRA